MPGLDAALADWQVFFAGQLGAGATLVGLLFVGLSLNLARILAAPERLVEALRGCSADRLFRRGTGKRKE